MEKSNNVVVVPLDAQWNDIGAWPALYDIGKKIVKVTLSKVMLLLKILLILTLMLIIIWSQP